MVTYVSLPNQNMIPSSKYISQYSKNENKDKENVITMIANGKFDDKIIEIYKNLKLDLKKGVSGAEWKHKNSSFRDLAENIGLDRNDDNIIKEIYRILIYNKRSIRDKMMSKNQKVKSFQPITNVEIPFRESETSSRPIFPSQQQVSSKGPSITEKKSSSYVKPRSTIIKRQQKSLTDVPIVNWGLNPTIQTCPICNFYGMTNLQYKIGCCTWTWAIALILSGICLPCSWFPCALNCTKDILHTCSQCSYILGKIPRNPFSKAGGSDLNEKNRSINEKLKSITRASKKKVISKEEIEIKLNQDGKNI